MRRRASPASRSPKGRHIDVLEMDAATRTGIDDIREIVDSVRYAPTSARYKVYIIDEVHMLSEKAFNGLLKTLEEPPPQTIFIFATTEVRKVPVTVLSRCQRFDLRRVEGELLQRHLGGDRRQGGGADRAGRARAASCAPPKVRCATGCRCSTRRSRCAAATARAITAAQVQDMLGPGRPRPRARPVRAVAARRDQGRARMVSASSMTLGTEPEAVLQDLLEISHWLTRIKVAPEAAEAFGVAQQDVRARPGAGRAL